MAIPRIAINRLGPLGRQVLREVARRGEAFDVLAAHDEKSRPELVARLLEREGLRRGPRTQWDGEVLVADQLRVRLMDRSEAAELELDVLADCAADSERFGSPRCEIGFAEEPGGSLADSVKSQGGRVRLSSAAAHASVAVLDPLDEAFGLRWCLISRMDGEGAELRAASGEVAQARRPQPTPLARELAGVRPDWAGKLETTSMRAPVVGSMLALTCTLDGAPNLNQVLEELRGAHDPHQGYELVPGPLSSGHALGDARVLVDEAACRGVGPLIRLVLWFDPLALHAARLVDACLRAGSGGSTE